MPNEDKIELITPATYDQAVRRAISKVGKIFADERICAKTDILKISIAIGTAYRFLRDEIFGDCDDE